MKTPLQRFHWLKKHTPNRCFLPCKRHTAAALSTLCYSSRAAVVSVVSAFSVHFLTFIDNYPIFQKSEYSAYFRFRRFGTREYSSRNSFPLFPFASCIWGQSYNIITNKPNNLRKKFS